MLLQTATMSLAILMAPQTTPPKPLPTPAEKYACMLKAQDNYSACVWRNGPGSMRCRNELNEAMDACNRPPA